MLIDLARVATWMPVYGGPLAGARYYPSVDPVRGGRVSLHTPVGGNRWPSPGHYEFARIVDAVVWRPADNKEQA